MNKGFPCHISEIFHDLLKIPQDLKPSAAISYSLVLFILCEDT